MSCLSFVSTSTMQEFLRGLTVFTDAFREKTFEIGQRHGRTMISKIIYAHYKSLLLTCN